jgi:type 1 glutamine amidotransferase
MTEMNRRDVLKWSVLAASSMLLGCRTVAADATKPRKVLFFTKSSGYEHSVIKRKNGELGYAEKILVDLSKQHSIEITASKDGRLFTPEKLAEFDAFVFMTTGDLTQSGKDGQPPMPPGGKQALFDAVRGGKGFVGVHCASDTFNSAPGTSDPYFAMLGGEFIIHGKQQPARSRVVDPNFPGLKGQSDFTLNEEWYTLKDFADDLHVILVQETAGMKGDMYQRPVYPSTWARMYGKGRVFYTSMGHREDIWTNPLFQNLLMGGLAWSLGEVDADITPNLHQTAPGPHSPASQPARQ